jgi:hypothetical protein
MSLNARDLDYFIRNKNIGNAHLAVSLRETRAPYGEKQKQGVK